MSDARELPTAANWRFANIAKRDPARARSLDFALSPDDLVVALTSALDRCVREDNLRIGIESASSEPQHHRVVLQFHAGASLYDQFFNARTGYRAHFRAHYERGLRFNARIIEAFRELLQVGLGVRIVARQLGCDFQDHGIIEVSKDLLLKSLDPHLSKIWTCTKRINGDGTINELPYGIDGEIELAAGESWIALCRDDELSWLDVKGAFLGEIGTYQLKDPVVRAKQLHARGSA